VPVGHQEGDYAILHGNGGSGDIDWDTPLSNEAFELFPRGAGLHGWGYMPWGYFPWGYGYSTGPLGWGYLPWGYFPWGYGCNVIVTTVTVEGCGEYKFGFACYDKFGNVHEGSPEEETVVIHIAPAAPAGLKKVSYNKDTDVLVLAAA